LAANSTTLTASGDIPSQLRGWINTFYVTQSGVRRGPYHARVWKVGPKTFKEYIKPADLEKVRAACQAYRERRKRQRARDKELSNLYGNVNYLYRLAKRESKGPLRPEDYEHMRRIDDLGYFIPGRPNLRPRRRFMVPFFSKSQESGSTANDDSSTLNAERSTLPPRIAKRIVKCCRLAIADLYASETLEEKWQRWENEHNAAPKAPEKYDIELPSWIT